MAFIVNVQNKCKQYFLVSDQSENRYKDNVFFNFGPRLNTI